jgi:hypothetical protein
MDKKNERQIIYRRQKKWRKDKLYIEDKKNDGKTNEWPFHQIVFM